MKRTLALIFLLVISVQMYPQNMTDDQFRTVRDIFKYQKSFPINYHQISSAIEQGQQKIHFAFQGWTEKLVSGTLVLPDTLEKTYPVFLLIHGFAMSRTDWDQNPEFGHVTSSLLDQGYAVLTLDLMYHGSRKHENTFREPMSIFQNGWMSKIRDMLVGSTIEHSQIIDHFKKSGIISPDEINVLGFSTGGLITYYLSSMRKDINRGVAWAVPPDPGTHFLRPVHHASRIEAKQFVIAAGKQDRFYLPEQVNEIHGLINSKKHLLWYDAGHELTERDFQNLIKHLSL